MAHSVSALQLANSVTLPVLGRVGGTRFWQTSRMLKRQAGRTLAERRAEQLRSLNRLLARAARNVPLLRERLDNGIAERGLRDLEEIQALPIISKADMMAGFPDRVVDEELDRSDWQFVSTSGTVSRVVTVKDFARRDMERAAVLHSLRSGIRYKPGLRFLQIPPNICNIVCGEGATNEDESFIAELFSWLARTLRGKSADIADLRGAFERRIVYHMRILSPLAPSGTELPEERLAAFWERIRRERPFVLHALPEYMYLLSEWAIAKRLEPLAVDRLIPMGGSTTPFMRERITRGLGGIFTDFYGTAELGPVAFETSPGEGLRQMMELFLVEVVRDGRPAEAGELGKLLITDLTNHAMPFVRYEVGDVALWWPAPEESDDQSPRLRIVGRLDELLEGPAGSPVSPETFSDRLFVDADCLCFCVREREGMRLQIDYVPRSADVDAAKVVDSVKPILHSHYRIKARAVRNIPAEPSGKFRFIRAVAHGVRRLDG